MFPKLVGVFWILVTLSFVLWMQPLQLFDKADTMNMLTENKQKEHWYEFHKMTYDVSRPQDSEMYCIYSG